MTDYSVSTERSCDPALSGASDGADHAPLAPAQRPRGQRLPTRGGLPYLLCGGQHFSLDGDPHHALRGVLDERTPVRNAEIPQGDPHEQGAMAE